MGLWHRNSTRQPPHQGTKKAQKSARSILPRFASAPPCVRINSTACTPQHLLWALVEIWVRENIVTAITVDERTRHHARVALGPAMLIFASIK